MKDSQRTLELLLELQEGRRWTRMVYQEGRLRGKDKSKTKGALVHNGQVHKRRNPWRVYYLGTRL